MGKVVDISKYRKYKLEVIEQRELTIEEQYNIAFKEILREYSSLEEYYEQLYN